MSHKSVTLCLSGGQRKRIKLLEVVDNMVSISSDSNNNHRTGNTILDSDSDLDSSDNNSDSEGEEDQHGKGQLQEPTILGMQLPFETTSTHCEYELFARGK
jgi:hypothetical protein